MTMCHGISGHEAEQSVSLNVSKTNVSITSKVYLNMAH